MRRFIRACALLALCAFSTFAAAAEVYDKAGDQIAFDIAPTGPLARLPVLFVWWDRGLLNHTSFKETLALHPELDIEPYYIRFADHGRSIVDDARDIAVAVDDII